MVHDMLQQPLCPWQDGTGNFNDIVIDSRVRWTSNLKKYVFPDKASDTELAPSSKRANARLVPSIPWAMGAIPSSASTNCRRWNGKCWQ